MVSSLNYNYFIIEVSEDENIVNNITFDDDKRIFNLKIRVLLDQKKDNQTFMNYLTVNRFDPIYNSMLKLFLKFRTIKSLYTLIIFFENPNYRNLSFDELIQIPKFQNIESKIEEKIWDYIRYENFLKNFII